MFARFFFCFCIVFSTLGCCNFQLVGEDEEQPADGLTLIEDSAEVYGQGHTEINFDEDLQGNPIAAKQKLDDLFADLGVRLKSESKNSNIVAFRYNCGSRSQAYCAGNRERAYEGCVRIEFHEPAKPEQPATVKMFGMYLALVKENGTAIEAYDSQDKLIGKVTVQKGAQVFLGASSKTPIAYLRIVPNEDIDSDFAFDDLVFDKPQAIEKK